MHLPFVQIAFGLTCHVVQNIPAVPKGRTEEFSGDFNEHFLGSGINNIIGVPETRETYPQTGLKQAF